MADKTYQEELEIDQHCLDEEWVEQPRLYFKYSEMLADAKYDVDKARERRDIKRANLDLEIRQDPEAWGINKIVEAVVTNTILLDDDFRKVQDEYHKAQHTVEILQAAVWAFGHRKTALENLVRLHAAQYYSTPDAGPLPEAAREHLDQVERKNTAERMKRRRRNKPNEDN